jgi:universal stress protein E
MSQYEKILLITQPDMQESAALTRATALAYKSGAVLHLCLIDYSPTLAGLRHVDAGAASIMIDTYMKARLAWLKKQCDELKKEGIKAEFSAVWGKPADQMILGKVLEVRPDLLIKDVNRAHSVARLFHTPLDWQLLRLSPVPVMLVSSEAHDLPRRIIATVDPMESERGPAELNDRVLQTALAMAIQCEAELHAVYALALELPQGEGFASMLPMTEYEKIRRQMREDHTAAFNKLMDKHSVPADRRHLIEGVNAENIIPDFASQSKSDLVVMGTVYRTGVDRFIFGSTAERVLYRLDCDVLALKPAGFQANLQQWFNSTVTKGVNYSQEAA